MVELNLTHDQIMNIIHMSAKEIEENLENQVKAQELQNMIQPKSVKDKIAMFNKRIAKAETEKAMKKVSQSLL